ncbi:hypothetical protein GCM10009795_026700 [Nocardioides hankookensis]
MSTAHTVSPATRSPRSQAGRNPRKDGATITGPGNPARRQGASPVSGEAVRADLDLPSEGGAKAGHRVTGPDEGFGTSGAGTQGKGCDGRR